VVLCILPVFYFVRKFYANRILPKADGIGCTLLRIRNISTDLPALLLQLCNRRAFSARF
jgi:hypothetical protein